MSSPCFWILDTRLLWSGEKITDAAPTALDLIPAPEATRAKAYHFLRDAKLALASSLLKRLFIVRSLGTPWPEVTFARRDDPQHGKPCHVPADGSVSPLDFNVSHQAGLVALVGCRAAEASVGVDVVCAHERNDVRSITRAGFADWVDMHAEVFSAADVAAMKAPVSASADSPADELEAKIRRFYAYWGLKEAYVKLVGEGLLAAWLRETEFRGVRVPVPAVGTQLGETVTGIEVWRDGVRVQGVELVLQSFEQNHMIATAIKQTPGCARMVPEFQLLDVERDVYPVARG